MYLIVLVKHVPIFGSSLFCPLFCDYGDDDDSGGGSFLDDILSIFDSSEETSKPEATPQSSVAPSNDQPQEVSLLIPPSNGMNLTVHSLGSSLLLSLFPWIGESSATTTAASTTAASTTPAGNGTAANATAA
ncbi:uncharacterized protein LOC128672530 isoform X2 [Plodia interpunctella]|uniref:uncharacterized protein LOC128672530 isoform X2 n=1 Tax=Plodia interpunctella TaxID=58824 RepID=UPI002367DFB3|nr:uncharacterized protein LOC128672530 isoform X2 [Plodia interpunctella]